ncbi:hypothetical protein STEG23_004897, partial [Scotinomys teguina]
TQCSPEGSGQSGLSSYSVCPEPCPRESECILEAPGNWNSIMLKRFSSLLPPSSVVFYAAFLSSHQQQLRNKVI